MTMHENSTFILQFEMENSLAILTRINSLLFRKRVYPLSIHFEYNTKNDSYKAKIKIQDTPLVADNLSKQIHRLVGVSDMSLEKVMK